MNNKKKKLMRSAAALCTAVVLLAGLLLGMERSDSVKNHAVYAASESERNLAISDSTNGEPIPGEYIVKKKNGDVELVKTKKGIESLKKDGEIVAVEQNRVVAAFDTELSGRASAASETQIKEMQYGDEMVRAPEAWDMLPEDTAKVRVAVIDTGIDATHPDLKGKVIKGTTIIDTTASGNKYADDGKDDHGHGTHVSGIIAATWNNGMGIDGVTGKADIELLPVKVLNDEGKGSTYDIIKGIEYAADHGASVLNLSLGSGYSSSAEAEAVRYAQNKGCLVIAAAGNDAIDVSMAWPASYDGVISVGSVDAQEERSYFSNYGETLDVAAPGSDIISSIPKAIALQEMAYGNTVYGNDTEGYYASWSGTSMATPHAAGVAALYKAANPAATGADIGDLMINTARDVGDIGKDIETGSGIIDAAAMLGADVVKTPLRVVNPKANKELYEEVLLSAQVNPTMDIKNLKFYLDEAKSANLIGQAECSSENIFYKIPWDTTKNTDGKHTILAAVYNSQGEQVGETQNIQVSILNKITNGFTLQAEDPHGTKASRAAYHIYGKTQNGTYSLIKSGITSELGYSRIKGLSDTYTEFKTIISGKYATDTENGYYVYVRDFSNAELGTKMILSQQDARKINCTTENADGDELSKYYLRLGIANGDSWLADLSPLAMNSDTELYLTEGTYQAEAFQSADEKGNAYLLKSQWNVSSIDTEMSLTAADAAKIQGDYALGVGGVLKLEGSSPKDEIPFMGGYFKGKEIYVSPGGEYIVSADLKAEKGGRNWELTVEKPDRLVIKDNSPVILDFKPQIEVSSFELKGMKADEAGKMYMYTGETMTSENGFGDTNGDIIKQAAQTYPTFRICQIIDGEQKEIYAKTDRGNTSSSYWNSRIQYNGNVPPSAGEYIAQLSYDAGPFGGETVLEQEFSIKTRSGSEEMSSTIIMDGKDKMSRATMDLYTWEGSEWQKASGAKIGPADEEGVIRNIKTDDILLGSTGINAAVITFNGKKAGYGNPDDYAGFAVIPFKTLDDLKQINIDSGNMTPLSVGIYDKNNIRRNGDIYLPALSDGGKLSEAQFVEDVKLSVTQSLVAKVYIPKGAYQYVYSNFYDGIDDYFLNQGAFDTEKTSKIELKGEATQKVTLNMSPGYKNLKMITRMKNAGEGVKLNLSANNSLYMTPGSYEMGLEFCSADKNYRYTIDRDEILNLTKDTAWDVETNFVPSIKLNQTKLDEKQTLLGKLHFGDGNGNSLTGAEMLKDGFYAALYPKINVRTEDGTVVSFDQPGKDGYQTLSVDPSYYPVKGAYYVSVSYDLGQGEMESVPARFVVGMNYDPELTPAGGSEFKTEKVSESEWNITAEKGTQGYLPVMVQLNDNAEREREIVFTQYRDNKKMQSITVKSIFAAKDNNTLSAAFNIRPGDKINVSAK